MLNKSRELKAGSQICMDKMRGSVWGDQLADEKSSALLVRSWPKLESNYRKPRITKSHRDNCVRENCIQDIKNEEHVLDSDPKHWLMEKHMLSKNTSTIQSDEKKNHVKSGNKDTSELKDLNDDYDISLKMNKLQIKEKRRIKREEEIRKKMIGPKCQYLKIIDSSLMEMITDGKKNKKLYDNNFQLSGSLAEFPDLCALPTKTRQKDANLRCITASSFHKISDEAVDERDEKITKTCYINNRANNKKKVKTSDPIEFNIGTAIALQKKQKVMKLEMVKESVKKKRLRMLSGNKLDSDNPLRKRGKFRENSKIKLSRVKKTILKHRQVKVNLMNEQKMKLLNCNKLLLNNVLDGNDIFYCRLKKSINYNRTADTNFDIDPKILIHSRKFRRYCDQWPNKEMNQSVHKLIKVMVRYQDRHYNSDPIKAYARRRYVCGFHQVLRCININKVKLVVIATDIEFVNGEDSLVNFISQVTNLSDALSIPYVYCGSRWSLKSCFKKKSPISCAAILNYDGAEELYNNIICLLPQVKDLYHKKLYEAEQKCGIRHQAEDDVTNKCIESVLNSLTINNSFNIKCTSENQGEVVNDELVNNFSDDESCPFMTALLKCCKDN